MPELDLIVPGDPASATGGYVYDRRILAALGALGWQTRVHPLDRSFPHPTRAAIDAARDVLAAIPDRRAVVLDGLALGGLAPVLEREARRLRLIALIHHPLADETGLDARRRAALRRAEREALAQVERIVVTSGWTAARLRTLGVADAPIAVVPPGTDRPAARRGRSSPQLVGERSGGSQRSAPSGARACGDGGLEDDGTSATGGREIRLLCVATLTPRKGHALLLEALNSLRDLPWRLDCVGSAERDPSTAAELRRSIARLGLGGRVALHGEVGPAALERSYREADVFVLASYLEGYGMALADALARGLPIVATSAGAIPDTVPAGAGLLVPAGDRNAMRAALGSVIRNGSLRRRLAAGARAGGRSLPTWAEAGGRFAAAIGDLAGGAAGG